MRITDISVDGFGVWHDLELRKLSPEVTLFHGLNEAGKTTLMQFLRSVLYGVSDECRAAYLPPINGGEPGGSLGLVTDDGPFRVSRYVDLKRPSTLGDHDIGRVRVQLPGGEQQGDRLLREAIEHVDESTFNNVFAVGLDEIQLLGTLGGSEAAEWIYRLTSGLDRISLYDVIQGLRTSQAHLLGGTDDTKSKIANLIAEKQQLEGEIAELAGQTRTWCERGVEIAEIDQQIETLRADLRQRERRARRVEVAMGIRPQWAERDEVMARLKSLSGLHPLEASAIDDLDALKEKIEEHERQRDILKGQRHQLRDEAESLGINEALANNCCRIEGLSEQQEWLESLAAQSAEHEAEADKLAARFDAETSRLAQQWFGDSSRRLELTTEQLEELAPQREAMKAAEKALTAASLEYETYRDEAAKFESQLSSATSSSERLGLPTNLQDAGELVARLRQRLNVEQKIEQTRRNGVELEQQARDMLDAQVIPLRLYVAWAGCVFGAAALITAWFITGTNPGLGQAGALLAFISVLIPFMRWASESRMADDQDSIHRQIEELTRQLNAAREEKEQLDEDLAVADGSVVLRLQTAEKHLAELEDMLPVESDRRRATETSRAAKQQYDAAKQRMTEAEKDWRGALKALGLPEQLAPKEVNLLAGQYEQLAALENKAQSRVDEMQRRQREFDRVVNRIERLAEQTGLVKPDAEPLEQLEHLLSESRMQQAQIEHRKKLAERAKELKVEEARHARAAIGFARKRDALFQSAGVEHETAFRQLAADLAEVKELEQQRTALTREIVAAIGALGDEQDFAGFFAPEVVGKLENDWEQLTSEHEEVESEVQTLVAKRTKLVESQRVLSEDASLSAKQIELGEVEAKLERAQQGWRERAVVSQMLENVRHDYEQHRQPETLLEATNYFTQLTGGHYTRVWTPLADDVLYVDRVDASTGKVQSLKVDSLSRGTREQLFLSVRMAVVAMFARRGIQLPMILDDVLVNYDEKRAAVAAKVLCEFAADGHQCLVFTCHEHILSIFKKLSADARRLPSRFGDVEVEPEVEEVVEVIEPEVVEEVVEPEPEPVVVEEEIVEPEPVEFEYASGIAPREVEPEPPVEYKYAPLPVKPEVEEVPQAIEYEWRHDDPDYTPDSDAEHNSIEYSFAHDHIEERAAY